MRQEKPSHSTSAGTPDEGMMAEGSHTHSLSLSLHLTSGFGRTLSSLAARPPCPHVDRVSVRRQMFVSLVLVVWVVAQA